MLAILLLALTTLSLPARAGEGCTVMLCLAGNWRDISQCVPPVKKAFRDVARGRGWPSCSMAGAGNYARTSRPPCPPQYLVAYESGESGTHYSCRFTGAIESRVNGQQWSRTWWNRSGDTVTEWFTPARTQFEKSGTPLDDRFDRDHAEWVRAEEEKAARAAQNDQSGG